MFKLLIVLVLKRVFHWLWWPVKVSGLANVKIGERRLVTRVAILTSRLRTGILPNPVEIGGHKFFYGPSSRSSIYDYLGDKYEMETAQMVDKLLQAGDVFVDVGANIGYFTLKAASRVGITGKVHAFEPFPETYEALEKTVLANEYGERTNVSCTALSDAPGEQKFFLATRGSNFHSQVTTRQDQPFIVVPVTTLDDYFERIDYAGPVKIVKIDVEGAEINVLGGMSKTAQASPDLSVIFEYHPSFVKETACSGGNLFEALGRLKITKFYVLDSLNEPTEVNPSYQDFDRHVKQYSYVNVLARKLPLPFAMPL